MVSCSEAALSTASAAPVFVAWSLCIVITRALRICLNRICSTVAVARSDFSVVGAANKSAYLLTCVKMAALNFVRAVHISNRSPTT